MRYLHPIEPLLLLPPPDRTPCVDRYTEPERRQRALARTKWGLRGLVGHPNTPDTAVRGIADGKYARVGKRGVFLHREDYQLEGSVSKTRWGVVVGLDPVASQLSSVVTAPRETIDALMSHLRVAGVDPGGITALYRDEEHLLEQLIEARGNQPPLLTLENTDNGSSQVWMLSEEESEAVIHLLESSGGTLVGDVALYRAILRLRDEAVFSPRSYPLVHFYNQRDFGVTLASCTRVHSLGEEFDLNALVAALHRDYEVTEFRVDLERPSTLIYRDFLDMIRTEGITQKVTGLIVGGIDTAFMVRVPDGQRPPAVENEVPDHVLEYDVEWVQRGIVRRFFPVESHEPRDILTEPHRVGEYLRPQGRDVALVLNPPPKRHIKDLSELSWRLPFGSLQLKPPVPRGLFLLPFRPIAAEQHLLEG